MELAEFLGAVAGEGGVIALLAIFVFFLLNGKVLPKGYVDEIRETNKINAKALESQAESLEVLSKSVIESLENSRTTLKIISEQRSMTGVRGNDTDDDSRQTEK